jgi:hypothetical protein
LGLVAELTQNSIVLSIAFAFVLFVVSVPPRFYKYTFIIDHTKGNKGMWLLND